MERHPEEVLEALVAPLAEVPVALPAQVGLQALERELELPPRVRLERSLEQSLL